MRYHWIYKWILNFPYLMVACVFGCWQHFSLVWFILNIYCFPWDFIYRPNKNGKIDFVSEFVTFDFAISITSISFMLCTLHIMLPAQHTFKFNSTNLCIPYLLIRAMTDDETQTHVTHPLLPIHCDAMRRFFFFSPSHQRIIYFLSFLFLYPVAFRQYHTAQCSPE